MVNLNLHLNKNSIFYYLSRIWFNISTARKYETIGLLCLMVLTSFAEIFTIGAVVPFLIVLTAPEISTNSKIIYLILKSIEKIFPSDLLLSVTGIFLFAALLSGGMRLLLLYISNKITYSTGGDLGLKIYRNTLYRDYNNIIQKNSSEIINGVWYKTNIVTNSIMMILTLVGSLIMLIFIFSALILINPLVTFLCFGGFGIIYLIIIISTRKRLLIGGEIIADRSSKIIKVIQEGLGNIRDVILDGSQEAYCHSYKMVDQPLRNAQGGNAFIAASPRYIMEALGMILISLVAFVLTRESNAADMAVPTLGAIALGAQRLLPILHQIYNAYSTLMGNKAALRDSVELLKSTTFGEGMVTHIHFEDKISLKDIDYRYDLGSVWVLKNLNIEIARGSRVGIIGRSGSGKSTLVDILVGLLQPTRGALEIDCQKISKSNLRAWQKHVAHVPQVIFLADASVAENIAIGVPVEKIDMQKVMRVAQQAEINGAIRAMPEQYHTMVGERGVKLSGGERQRLGIARALYKEASVIIFDEATSALDVETEAAVMKTIDSLNRGLTVIIISHRMESLKKCDRIIKIDNGLAIDLR